jgi:hypothetical protein
MVADGVMYAFGFISQDMQKFYNSTDGITNLLQSLNTGFLFASGILN